MDPSDNNPHKRILPYGYCKDGRETKKIKSTTEEMEIFSSVDFEDNPTGLENLNEIEACDLTEEYKKLPEIWHAAKRKDWATVRNLLSTCEDYYCSPTIGPDKDKCIIILAILSEQWDIVDYINNINELITLPEIDELEKLIKIIVKNKRWGFLYTEFIFDRITLELFDLILNQAVNTREGEDFDNAINSILDLFRDCSFSLTNKQFNDVVLYYLETIPNTDKAEDLWEYLNVFFETNSDPNLTLDFDVHLKLVEFYNLGILFASIQDDAPSEITLERIFKVNDDVDLMLALLQSFSFQKCQRVKNLIEMNPWFNEISLKGNKTIKEVIYNILLVEKDTDMLKILLNFQARTGIPFCLPTYEKLYFQNITSNCSELISSLIDAGIEIPSIDKFSIPIFDTFDRIYEICHWEGTFNNAPQRLPQEINFQIARILIDKELPELSFLPDSFFLEKMTAYFAKKQLQIKT